MQDNAERGWAWQETHGAVKGTPPQERKVYALYDFTEKGLLRLRKARKEAMQAGDDARVKQLDEAEQQAQARVVKAYNAAR